jgi:putative exosortase-associated protein (TIGR04073 family)
MRKNAILILCAIAIIALCAKPCTAEDADNDFTANDKFTRGIVNCTTFYLEVPMSVYKTTKEENPVTGVLFGLPAGIAKGLVRFGIGVVETLTFPFEPYAPLIEPEYLITKE